MNEKTSLPGNDQSFTLAHGDGSYFACLSLSPALCAKVGIRDGDDLMRYLVATIGLHGSSMRSEGVETPMVRLNINEMAEHSALLQSRLEKLVTKISNSTAPPMRDINKGLDQFIAQAGTLQQPRAI